MPLRVADLEVLFTANTAGIQKAEADVKQLGKTVEGKPIEQKVGADTSDALAGMDRVEQAAKRIVSHDTAVQIDANIDRATKGIDRTEQRLEYLRSVETELDVSADIKRAEARLDKLTRQRDALTRSRETITVDANTVPAEEKLDEIEDHAAESGSEAGDNLGDGILTALKTIPIAGAVVGIAAAVGTAVHKGFTDGLQQEVTRDQLKALTGIDEATARRFAVAAGEAYSLTFGESIEANMDTSRLALQFNILDEDATQRQAQKTIEGLTGISEVLGEEVRPIAAAVSTMLATGVVKSASEAYDVLATGAREGVNRNEDLLDTFTEYPALFDKLGLSGQEALGLVNQGMQAGARNSDLAADALKEFQIRATDASEASAEGFELLGLNAEEMTAKIARGGDDARDGLAQVLDGLRDMEDPVARNQAAIALFGTQAEDLGEALFAMDLSTAVDELDGVTGAAQRMFDTLKDNDATKMEAAKRNIQVAVEGIQGALANAFSDPLGDFADWVSTNRGPLMSFLGDLVNGAFDIGVGFLESLAGATEGIGEFIGGPLADLADMMGRATVLLNPKMGAEWLQISNDMRGFGEAAETAADVQRDTLIPTLEAARDKVNEFFDPAIATGYIHDAALETADAVSQVGISAKDGTELIDAFTIAKDGTVEASSRLTEQLEGAIGAMEHEREVASLAGESQAELEERYDASREALVGQLVQMGLTEEGARALIAQIEKTPSSKRTSFSSNATSQKARIDGLRGSINSIPGYKKVTITAEYIEQKQPGWGVYRPGAVIETPTGLPKFNSDGTLSYQHDGAIVELMAEGGVRGLAPMAPIAQTVSPNTWRVVGDRPDVPELYLPLDGSPRSWALLMEGLHRMPGSAPMADGGILSTSDGTSARRGTGAMPHIGLAVVNAAGMSPEAIRRMVRVELRKQMNDWFSRGGL
ncbi:phage tail tape measure protein [Microbacterium halophytorum]|uniref:phage tail tape measure protein n=1 Tax=Microbacterium halophytorum TaxID=2067568 RepID=UPI000CFB1D0E|nr:phage tail tape measure protein [Microbacterium halophytorum]